ncbi:P-loop containing nucleoside triphosphate hydrolase protein, partial [Aureobasidium melanogenum]
MPTSDKQSAAAADIEMTASNLATDQESLGLLGCENLQTSRQPSQSVENSFHEANSNQKRRWPDLLNPFRTRSKPQVPNERQPSPESGANFLSLLTFQWLTDLMQVGYARPLELNDIWNVGTSRSVPVMQAKLSASFERRFQNGDRSPLRNALYDTFRKEFLIGGACSLIASVLQVLSPFMLRYLIQFATDAYTASHGGTEAPPVSHGIAWVVSITIVEIVQTLCFNHFLYRGMMVGGQSRAVLIALIFNKATKLSGRAKVAGATMERPAPGMKPDSEQEKRWVKRNLGRAGTTTDRLGWSDGRIINLMSMDTSRVNSGSIMLHFLWTSPIAICLALALLLVNITYSALPGFALLILIMPLLARAVKAMIARRRAITPITERRVSLIQEILHSVRLVKYFSWEFAFLDRLNRIRKEEIRGIRAMLTIRHAVTAIGTTISTFAAMLAFITFALSGHKLTSSHVFSSLSLFGALSMPLNQLPQVLGHVTDAAHSISRIQDFLLAEEFEEPVVWDFDNDKAIVLENAEFVWERSSELQRGVDAIDEVSTVNHGQVDKKGWKRTESCVKTQPPTPGTLSSQPNPSMEPASDESSSGKPFSLGNLNLTVGRHELVAIIGPVGSGKSSLLAALAGDMRRTAGSITLGASRSFCSQTAWIQNASVKENIIMGRTEGLGGSTANDEWYARILDTCALLPDLEIFPHGDSTELGERGINLSGGQRQRLNIARAIYSGAELILMDDPLSAVDAQVGQHIMNKAICGLLKDRCRILATHQLHLLHRCDRIIYLAEGQIIADGTFSELMANSIPFQRIMTDVAREDGSRDDGKNEQQIEERDTSGKAVDLQPALMQAEERAIKRVSWSVYAAYMRASGTILNPLAISVLLIATQGSSVSTGLWLSWWTSDKFGFRLGTYIGIFAALGVTQAFLAFAFYVYLTISCTNASQAMLREAVARVLRAPVSFFDTTPLGRITNRFSKDVDTMDNNLSDSLLNFLLFSSQIVAVFILTIVYFPYFAVALAVLAILVLFSVRYYRSSARELKRHEALLRSHVFTRFGEAISGVSTIRAYRLQQRFTALVNSAVDDMDGAYFLTFANQCWLSTRLDAAGNAMVLAVGILVVTSRLSINPSISGLLLSSMVSVVKYLQYSVRQLAEVENNMNSAERLHHYAASIEQEAAFCTAGVPPTWPEWGEIVFDDVHMRYRRGLPDVLHGLNIRIRPGERMGIVGRTGAGKSSILSTLFRLVELSHGTIIIDGMNIAKIGLHDLRSRLSIIPQDPTLFQGTIRSNLDPFNKHTDLELWSALRQADLVADDQGINGIGGQHVHLDTSIEEAGANFSLGQRQMIALARALVRNSPIIVCDEATSAVDFETDRRIQEAIMRGSKGKTLLCIAHRLRTILGYDRICVMDAGKIVELDTPLALWDQGGIFRSMCDRSGIARQDLIDNQDKSDSTGGKSREG